MARAVGHLGVSSPAFPFPIGFQARFVACVQCTKEQIIGACLHSFNGRRYVSVICQHTKAVLGHRIRSMMEHKKQVQLEHLRSNEWLYCALIFFFEYESYVFVYTLHNGDLFYDTIVY